ncbi:ATP-binding cassette domain-containing protein, partial [Sharpea azabuensis]|uniref:ATP-binding cassette domain-containing protein n=1 Tax=Sharpea azabuensis TaxID=322505 RepID=UPI001569ACE4
MKRVVELLNEKSNIVSKDNAIRKMNDGSIEFKKVNFSYANKKDKLNLKNVNIKINSGETIGIIGSTGSGKSTLVNLIPRLYDAFSGSVLVSGVDVKDYDLDYLRDNVA